MESSNETMNYYYKNHNKENTQKLKKPQQDTDYKEIVIKSNENQIYKTPDTKENNNEISSDDVGENLEQILPDEEEEHIKKLNKLNKDYIKKLDKENLDKVLDEETDNIIKSEITFIKCCYIANYDTLYEILTKDYIQHSYLELEDKNGNNGLHLIITSDMELKKKIEIIKLMIKNGINYVKKNNNGETPSDLIKVDEGELYDILQPSN